MKKDEQSAAVHARLEGRGGVGRGDARALLFPGGAEASGPDVWMCAVGVK